MSGEIIELTLDRPAHGGYCVGRHDGKAVFVRFGLPGERVRARIVQDKKRFAFAHVVEVLEAAPGRVVPQCAHYGACGGCHWQHADYAETLAFKQAIVQEQFVRVAGLPDAVVLPVLPSPDVYGYRAHVTLHVSQSGGLGFMAADSGRVLTIDECAIARPDLTAALDKLKLMRLRWPPGGRVRAQVGDGGRFTRAMLDAPETAGENDDDAVRQIGADEPTGVAVTYQVLGRGFRCSAGAFFQVNVAGAAVLVEQALARLNLAGGETVLDLYAGGGLFSAFLAERAGQVIAIESAPLSLADAQVNLADRPNVEIHAGLVEDVLPGLSADAAVCDPPRAGMNPAALAALIAAGPRQIAYVSCDPATLARDAKALVSAGYRLIDVQPVDMFPQTYHIECVAGFSLD